MMLVQAGRCSGSGTRKGRRGNIQVEAAVGTGIGTDGGDEVIEVASQRDCGMSVSKVCKKGIITLRCRTHHTRQQAR